MEERMEDLYRRYAPPSSDRVNIPPPAYPGYMPSEAPTLSSQPSWPSHNHPHSSSDYLPTDMMASRPGAYGVDDIRGIGVRSETGYGGYAAGSSRNGHPPVWEDSYLVGRRDVMHRSGPPIPDIVNERPRSLRIADGPLVGRRESTIPDIVTERPRSLRIADGPPVGRPESNVLFVDALPSDCTRREVSHLFRPFLGFKNLRLVHKEPRHSADKGLVLCFVEFLDFNHASIALEALQGYKFDNKKPDSPSLKIQFARFPFQLPPDREEQRLAVSSQLSPDREEQRLVTPRRREPSIEDEKPIVKKKFEKRKFDGSPQTSKKGKKVEAFVSGKGSQKEKPECAKCKKKHSGECLVASKACFICGEQDHMSRDCRRKAGRKCFKCGEKGHTIAHCPNSDSRPEKKGKASGILGKEESPKT